MTEQELEMIRLKLTVEAQSILLINLWRALMDHSPEMAESLQNKLKLVSEANSEVVFPGMHAGYSNLLADEFQDQLKVMIDTIEA